MATTTYLVKGMTCGDCANIVGSQVGAVPGVEHVTVELAAGLVAVTSTSTVPVDAELVRAAVDDAGYELVSD